MYVLKLYIVDRSPLVEQDVGKLMDFLEKEFQGQYRLEVISVLDQPEMAALDEVWATPTLIKVGPHPEKRAIGDFTVRPRLLALLTGAV